MNNATYKVFLRPGTTGIEGAVTLYIRVIIDRKKKDYSLKIQTNVKYWNESRQELRPGLLNWEKDNKKLQYYLNELKDLVTKALYEGKSLSFYNFDQVFNGDVHQKDSFYDFVTKQIKLQRGKITNSTIAVWEAEVSKLKKHTATLIFSDINVQFLKEYEAFLRDKQGNTPITIHKSHRFIKARLNEAIVEGLIKENPYARYKIGKAPEGNMERLTRAEVKTIEEKYMLESTSKKLKHVVRYFLFSCYTGLRYSDLKALTYGKVIEGRYIQIRMQKTGEPLRLDLPAKAKMLLGSGLPNESVFRVLSSQVTNRILKEVMTLAEINKSISIHCARHSFATIAGELGVPVEVIKELLGHSNINITLGYVKVTQPSLTRGMMLMDEI